MYILDKLMLSNILPRVIQAKEIFILIPLFNFQH